MPDKMQSRVAHVIKLARKGAIPKRARVKMNEAGYGFSFKVKDRKDGRWALLSLNYSLPSYAHAQILESKGACRIYVSVYTW